MLGVYHYLVALFFMLMLTLTDFTTRGWIGVPGR
jgi:hypothetical protein